MRPGMSSASMRVEDDSPALRIFLNQSLDQLDSGLTFRVADVDVSVSDRYS